MHALSKAVFFSTGAVGLLVLFLLGSILEFHAFSLEYFTDFLVNFRFMDYTLAEMLGLGKPESILDHLTKLKYGIVTYLGAFSIVLMVISFLPSLGIQLKVLSFAISIPALALLLGFWVRFISDDNLVSRSEKTDLFIVTLFAYPSSVFLLWYGLHVKRKKLPIENDSHYVPFQTSRDSSLNSITNPTDPLVDKGEQVGDKGGEVSPNEGDQITSPDNISKDLINEEAENMEQTKDLSGESLNGQSDDETIEHVSEIEEEDEDISSETLNKNTGSSTKDHELKNEEEEQPTTDDNDQGLASPEHLNIKA